MMGRFSNIFIIVYLLHIFLTNAHIFNAPSREQETESIAGEGSAVPARKTRKKTKFGRDGQANQLN